MFSVVMAVLLALAVNQWRTNRSNQQIAANALKNIIQETTSNQAEIDTSLSEHLQIQQILRSTLKEYRAADKKQQNTLSDSFKYGYKHSVLNNTAWNSANITQAIKFLKFDIVAGLSTIYELQRIYAEHGSSIISQMGSINYHEANFESFVKANLFNVSTTINIEQSLLEEYGKILNNTNQ